MFRNIFNAFLIIIFSVLCLQVNAYGSGSALLLKDEIDHLKAAAAALNYSEQDFQELSEQDGLSSLEILEYSQFIRDLKRQVLEACESVRALGGDGNQHGVDCSKVQEDPDNKKSAKISDIQRQPTREEQAAVLKGQLRELESDLDGMLLKQQEKLKKEAEFGQAAGEWGKEAGESGPTAAGGSSASNEGQAGSAEGAAQPGDGTSETAQAGGAAQGSGAGAGPGDQIQRAPGTSEAGAKEGGPADRQAGDPGGRDDDDVVARQLREAAEAETDPVLKEKLWEEYRKYKKSQR